MARIGKYIETESRYWLPRAGERGNEEFQPKVIGVLLMMLNIL